MKVTKQKGDNRKYAMAYKWDREKHNINHESLERRLGEAGYYRRKVRLARTRSHASTK